MTLLHGTVDTVTPYANAVLLHERAKEVSVPSTLITIENAGHMI